MREIQLVFSVHINIAEDTVSWRLNGLDSSNDVNATNDAAQETIRQAHDLVEQYFSLHPDVRRLYIED